MMGLMMGTDRVQTDDRRSKRRGVLFLVLILAGVGIGVGLSLQPSAIPTEASQADGQVSGVDSSSTDELTNAVDTLDIAHENTGDPQTDLLPQEDTPTTASTNTDSEPDSDSAIPSGPRRTEVGYDVGQFAPGFSLLDLDGRHVSLASYRGQVVLLDFWASWCSPCRQTLPHLHQIAVDHAGDGLVFIGINLDRRTEDAVSYLDDNPFHQMIPVQGTTAVAQQYGVSGIPRTFVIDRSGVIRFAGHPAVLVASAIEPWL